MVAFLLLAVAYLSLFPDPSLPTDEAVGRGLDFNIKAVWCRA